MNETLRKFLSPTQVSEIFPEDTELFVGITLVRRDGEWTQKSAFCKVQNLGKTYSKKTTKKITVESEMAKELMGTQTINETEDF
jgi:hypothetical protein